MRKPLRDAEVQLPELPAPSKHLEAHGVCSSSLSKWRAQPQIKRAFEAENRFRYVPNGFFSKDI